MTLNECELPTLDDLAACAAKYWADILRRDITPSLNRDAGFHRDGPDGALRGAFGDVLTRQIKSTMPALTDVQIDRFEELLASSLLTRLTEDPCWCTLGTDYHPDRVIYDAAVSAEIEPKNIDLRFPFKTITWINRESVVVREGYGAEQRVLFQTRRDALSRRVRELYETRISPWRKGAPAMDSQARLDIDKRDCDRMRQAFETISVDVPGDTETEAVRMFAKLFPETADTLSP